MSKEDKKGWVGSVLLHVALAVVFLLWRIDVAETETEFLEVSWGSFTGVPVQTAQASAPSSRPAGVPQTQIKSSTPVDLPLRQPSAESDILPLPRTRKSSVDDRPRASNIQVAEAIHGEKGSGVAAGEKERYSTEGGEGDGKPGGLLSSGGEGTEVGQSVGYSVQWGGGGTRKLLTGDLPEYPEGVNTQAQIKLEAVVHPNGRVRSVRPVQKADTRLEDAALKEVQLWVFEPLGQSVPQRDQTCVITFNFVLR